MVGSGNTVDAQTGDGFQLGDSGNISAAIPSTIFTSASWTIQGAFKYTNAPSGQWPNLFAESSGSNKLKVWWDTVAKTFRIYINGVSVDSTTKVDLSDGVKRWFRVVWDSSNTTGYLYVSADKSTWSLVRSGAFTQPSLWGGTTYFGSTSTSSYLRGVVDDIEIFNSAVIP